MKQQTPIQTLKQTLPPLQTRGLLPYATAHAWSEHDLFANNSAESCFAHDFSRIGMRSSMPIVKHNRSNVPSLPWIQAKLTIGKPGDKYEQEADRVAEQVMRMPEPWLSSSTGDSSLANGVNPSSGTIQRIYAPCSEEYKAAENEGRPNNPANLCINCREQKEDLVQTKLLGPELQRQEIEEKEGVPVSVETARDIQSLHGGGTPLSRSERAFFEPRFGGDFSGVRLHNNVRAAATAKSINARAFTTGKNIVFGAGEYVPGVLSGEKIRLLSHELAHVMQQQPELSLSNRRRPQSLGISSFSTPLVVQRKPSQVTAHHFLGLNIGGGVNPIMASRLDNVAAQLRQDYEAAHGTPAADDLTVRRWAGIYSIRGWRQRNSPSTSKHCSGSAVDVNYANQPYIVTRSNQANGSEMLGGERAGQSLTAQRQATVNVFDRAKEFVFGVPNRADVSMRRESESTEDVFDRFKETSDVLSTYLSLAFLTDPTAVRRRPIADIEAASETGLLAAIPETERKPEALGIIDIQMYMVHHMARPGDDRPGHYFTNADLQRARDIYFRMLRDYEHVRIPMVRGTPEARPDNTRNPARGFLDMNREFVVAMADVGHLRWGIADLDAESGDTHHFDLGNHGGVAADCLP